MAFNEYEYVQESLSSTIECDHREVTLIYEDDEGVDWQCLLCEFEGHDPYI